MTTMLKALALILLGVMLNTGCLKLERDYPERETYLLDVQRQADARPARAGVLRVLLFDISPRFQENRFVYRSGELQFRTDYYNRFLISPATLITEETSEWLADSGLFREVFYGPGRGEPAYFLEGTISSLYGDFLVRPPQAVLAVNVTLVPQGPGAEPLLHSTYRQQVPLEEESPEALARGWNEALRRILSELEDDLAAGLREDGSSAADRAAGAPQP